MNSDASDRNRNNDGTIQLRNPNIAAMKKDVLYHLALDTASHDLEKMFGDVRFVCMGGTAQRMESFANFITREIQYELPTGATLQDITRNSHRFSMFKVGPVLAVSHGMGVPSLGILLHEMIKLLYHARARNPTFFRIGTCGGIGVPIGTVVITNEAVNGMLEPFYEVPMLGKLVRRPAKLDPLLVSDLKAMARPDDDFQTVVGKTMCADDFYEGQGRLDGAFCEYTEPEKMQYLKNLQNFGVMNIEMEAVAFAALTHHAGIKAADVCVTFVDRLMGDQVETPKNLLTELQNRPQIIVARYIKKILEQ